MYPVVCSGSNEACSEKCSHRKSHMPKYVFDEDYRSGICDRIRMDCYWGKLGPDREPLIVRCIDGLFLK